MRACAREKVNMVWAKVYFVAYLTAKKDHVNSCVLFHLTKRCYQAWDVIELSHPVCSRGPQPTWQLHWVSMLVLHVLCFVKGQLECQPREMLTFKWKLNINSTQSSNKEKVKQVLGIAGRCWRFYWSFRDTLIFSVPTTTWKIATKSH